jgi:1-acyl-sn-glycerol-3-phosphate acyltransferase
VTALCRVLLLGFVRLLVGAYADWRGSPPLDRQRIYYANHRSHFDTLVMVAALPADVREQIHPVAALDYWGASRLRRFIALGCLNAVLIDRSGKASGKPLEKPSALLAKGHSLILFPEGTRGDNAIGPFKSGLYHLAQLFPAAELVPVFLDNPGRVMPKGSWLIVPLICTARFGAPLAREPDEHKAAFLIRARAALLGLANSQSKLMATAGEAS